jgi:hypothetical protein
MARSKWGRGGLHHPPSSEGSARVVRRAEVGGGAPRVAALPPGLVLAPDLEARAAALPLVEQRRSPGCTGCRTRKPRLQRFSWFISFFFVSSF